MKMVFEKFESALELTRDAVNVLRIEDRSLYARCALSASQLFSTSCLEPAYLFGDDGREINPNEILFFGDPISIDLNDKRIMTQAVKVLAERIADMPETMQVLEDLNFKIEDVFHAELVQMEGDYSFNAEWDSGKYLKLLGFSIDEVECRTISQRLYHLLRIASDLFPDKVLCFANLKVYLSEEQYNGFCELAVSLQLCILSYEQSSLGVFGNLENGLLIDADYLEG